MRRQAGVFARGGMLLGGNYQLVCFPEVAVAMALLISRGDALPQLLTRRLAAVADDVRDNLPSRSAQRNPNPTFARFFQDK